MIACHMLRCKSDEYFHTNCLKCKTFVAGDKLCEKFVKACRFEYDTFKCKL